MAVDIEKLRGEIESNLGAIDGLDGLCSRLFASLYELEDFRERNKKLEAEIKSVDMQRIAAFDAVTKERDELRSEVRKLAAQYTNHMRVKIEEADTLRADRDEAVLRREGE